MSKRAFIFLVRFNLIFIFFICCIGQAELKAAGGNSDNKTAFILHHIQDAHEWHFATIGDIHITLPLPVILVSADRGIEVFMSSKLVDKEHKPVEFKGYRYNEEHKIIPVESDRKVYDFSITKNVTSLFISVFILLMVFLTIAKKYKGNVNSAPRGIQALFEPVIIFIRDGVARPNIGEKKYEAFTPYLLTVFFFIWFNNLLGLLPGAANLTGNITVTLSLSLFTLVVTNISGSKDYWKHIFNTPGVPWWMKYPIPLMPLVEFIGIFTKPFSLMLRLFANITAGHIIIMSLIALVFIFQSVAFSPVSIIFGLFMNMVELLVAFIQAFVFTLLSAIYIGMAVEEHEHDHYHDLEQEEAHSLEVG
ncbi:MAG: F0F1 ATP synthase subunit A [Cyclobacteriaceae bacterium]|nr:F0F1 ATP synthase subunit A [Cyclobacteriaceae bacterium]